MTLHEQVQKQILDICTSMGLQTEVEYKGKDWRADVYTITPKGNYAFEIQLSPQSLKKTLERQAKYIRDGIIGCWLFENEPSRQKKELEELPVFRLDIIDNKTFVSLKDRKTLPLDIFIYDFLKGKIKFCHTLKPLPQIEVLFLEFKCWKCGTINHIYYLAPFQSACNTTIYNEDRELWSSNKLEFQPEIIKKVQEYAQSEKGKHLNLATIKKRFSRTIGKSYMSFGCNKCDSIFGDWYIHEAEMETWYGDGIIDSFKFNANFDLGIQLDIPHWCHPGKHDFCE